MVGARPQFIKAAVITCAIAADGRLSEVMVHTGQHFDSEMSGIFFHELAIPAPAYNLGVHGGGHGQMTGRMLEALEPVMEREQPDVVLVYGDTNSTLGRRARCRQTAYASGPCRGRSPILQPIHARGDQPGRRRPYK